MMTAASPSRKSPDLGVVLGASNTHIIIIFYVPSTFLAPEDIAVSKTKYLLQEAYILFGGDREKTGRGGRPQAIKYKQANYGLCLMVRGAMPNKKAGKKVWNVVMKAFELRAEGGKEVSRGNTQGQSFLSTENNWCRGPEAQHVQFRNSKGASVAAGQ